MLQKLTLWLCLMSTTLSAFGGDVLRYRTATTIKVGPLTGTQVIGETGPESFTVDVTVLLSKNGGKLEEVDTSLTLDSHNLYDLMLSAEMTDTYGRLDVVVINGDKVIKESYDVVNAEVWDEQHSAPKVGGHLTQVDVREWLGNAVSATLSGKPEVDIYAVGGGATAATNLEDAFDGSTTYSFNGWVIDGVESISTGGITSGSFAAGAIDSGAMAVGAIHSGVIVSGAVVNATLADNAITAAKIAADAIGASELATDAIGADEIATSAIGSLEIASNAIGSAEIATGAIGALELHASAVDEIVVDVKTELDTHGAGSWVDTGGGDATETKQDTIIAYINTEVQAILDDTNELQGDWKNTGRLDNLLDAVYTGTPPTVAQIRTEMDNNSADLNTLITGVNLTKINGTSIAGAGSQVADRWVGFWNQASAGYNVATALSSFKADVTNLDAAVSSRATISGVWAYTGGPGRSLTTSVDANLTKIDGHLLVGTGTQLADRFEDFFDQGSAAFNVSTALSNFKADVTNLDAAISTVATPAQVATALTDIHLDHLFYADYDPASKPGSATALLNELVESDGGVSRYTSNALEQAWSVGTRALTDKDDFTISGTIDTFDGLDTALDSAHGAGNWLTGSGTSTLTQAQVNTQVDNAIETYNLDHLMLTAVGNNANMTTEVTDGTVLSNIMSATSDTSTYVVADDSLEGISGVAGGATNPNMLLSTTVNGAPATQTQFVLAAGSNDDDAYKSLTIVLYDVSESNYPSVRTVTSYTQSSKTILIDAAPDFTLADTDAVKIFIADRTLDQASAVDGKTMRQVLRYLGAVIVGKTWGAGTGSELFKGLDGVTDRVRVSIDRDGNRRTIDYDP
jgi:hypothetical protein